MIDALTARVHNMLFRLRDREEGQGLVEYVTLIALIALALFIAVTFFADELGSVFSKIANKVQSELP